MLAGWRISGNLWWMAKLDEPFPFEGEVVWLTPEQGDRATGPPPASVDRDYAQLAHVPPHSAETGTASFLLRGFESGAWRSRAEGRWLVVENEGDQLLLPGGVAVVTEEQGRWRTSTCTEFIRHRGADM